MLPRASAVGVRHLVVFIAAGSVGEPCAAWLAATLPFLTCAVLPGGVALRGATMPRVAVPLARLPGAAAAGWRCDCGRYALRWSTSLWALWPVPRCPSQGIGRRPA